MNHYDFSGRAAVVTGGAQGIGLAVAQRLADGGAKLALWDHQEDLLAQACAQLPANVVAIKVDVADAAAVGEAAKRTQHALGRIDILVCSAGITGPNVALSEYSPGDWRRVFEVNVDGVFLCNRAIVPVMRDNDYGRIVNIASVAGKEGNPNASAYSASKAAVMALTKSLGKELANCGIRVNCVTPAAVRTAIFDQMTPEHIAFMLSKIPLARFGTTHEVASLVAWLASEECSFSTGAIFDVSGGRATY